MNIKLEGNDKKTIMEFLDKYKKQKHKIIKFEKFEKNGEKWIKCEINDLDIDEE